MLLIHLFFECTTSVFDHVHKKCHHGLQTNLFHVGPQLKILGAQTENLGAHTVNQHANQIFTFLLISTVLPNKDFKFETAHGNFSIYYLLKLQQQGKSTAPLLS